jgi:hypothetical protein
LCRTVRQTAFGIGTALLGTKKKRIWPILRLSEFPFLPARLRECRHWLSLSHIFGSYEDIGNWDTCDLQRSGSICTSRGGAYGPMWPCRHATGKSLEGKRGREPDPVQGRKCSLTAMISLAPGRQTIPFRPFFREESIIACSKRSASL